MIDTLLKYTIIDTCINMAFNKLFAVINDVPYRNDIIKAGFVFDTIEMRESMYTWRGIEFNRIDTYYDGCVNRVFSNGYIEVSSSRRIHTYRCSSDDFDMLYSQLQKETKIGRIQASQSGYITVEVRYDDIDTLCISDMVELVYRQNKKIIIQTFM